MTSSVVISAASAPASANEAAQIRAAVSAASQADATMQAQLQAQAEAHRWEWSIEAVIGKGVILGGLITWSIAFWAYKLYQKQQVKISRFVAATTFETEMLKLHAEKLVALDNRPEKIELRYALNGDKWEYEVESERVIPLPTKKLCDGQYYWLIKREQIGDGQNKMNVYLSSRAFHETLSWFRRAYRAYREGILTKDDLMHLWRQTTPFSYANALAFFSNYFKGDIEEMIAVLKITLEEAIKRDHEACLRYFRKLASDEDRRLLGIENLPPPKD